MRLNRVGTMMRDPGALATFRVVNALRRESREARLAASFGGGLTKVSATADSKPNLGIVFSEDTGC